MFSENSTARCVLKNDVKKKSMTLKDLKQEETKEEKAAMMRRKKKYQSFTENEVQKVIYSLKKSPTK